MKVAARVKQGVRRRSQHQRPRHARRPRDVARGPVGGVAQAGGPLRAGGEGRPLAQQLASAASARKRGTQLRVARIQHPGRHIGGGGGADKGGCARGGGVRPPHRRSASGVNVAALRRVSRDSDVGAALGIQRVHRKMLWHGCIGGALCEAAQPPAEGGGQVERCGRRRRQAQRQRCARGVGEVRSAGSLRTKRSTDDHLRRAEPPYLRCHTGR